MSILTQNSKMKKTSEHFALKVMNFNIPAGNVKQGEFMGKITCPFASDCLKFCYAKKGNYARFAKTIDPHMTRNYELTRKEYFADVMIDEVKRSKADVVRIHDSGDFYSREYVAKWFAVMRALPEVKFYAYTKSYVLFKGIEMPDNFCLIHSDGSKLPLDKTERHACIFPSRDALIDAGYIDASEYDLYATKWFNKSNKVGLIIH